MCVDGMKTVVLGMGGTIAGQAGDARDNVGYVAGALPVERLTAGLPGLAGLPLDVESVAQINSKDIDLSHWQALLQRLTHHLARPDVSGAVVTHGTDTIEETAWLLDAVLPADKPVVLTCAMRPASSVSPDGPQNLTDAVALARTPGARGVMLVCASRVHAGRDVAKVHPYRTDPFSSGDAGALGVVEEGVLRRFRPWPGEASPDDLARRERRRAALLDAGALPRVALLTSHGDADGAVVEALCRSGVVSGIVVAGTGNGSLHHDLQAALAAAASSGVAVRLASRCGNARVVPYAGQAFATLDAATPAQARLALALDLLGG